MTDQIVNFCVRCGKPRIVVKTWREHVKGSLLIHTTTACPDAACQKIVDRKFAARQEKREAIEEERTQRALASKLASQNRINNKKSSCKRAI